MILNISLVTLYCLDQDAARDFYVSNLGFEPRVDSRIGEFRWVTIGHPSQPELEVTLMTPGPPLSPEAAGFVRGQLESGQMGGLGLQVDDCRKTYEQLRAAGAGRAAVRRGGCSAGQHRQLVRADGEALTHPSRPSGRRPPGCELAIGGRGWPAYARPTEIPG
jgi:catechol 2,3-dioxygenase-like lactoylglutathione lyase family enzyme